MLALFRNGTCTRFQGPGRELRAARRQKLVALTFYGQKRSVFVLHGGEQSEIILTPRDCRFVDDMALSAVGISDIGKTDGRRRLEVAIGSWSSQTLF